MRFFSLFQKIFEDYTAFKKDFWAEILENRLEFGLQIFLRNEMRWDYWNFHMWCVKHKSDLKVDRIYGMFMVYFRWKITFASECILFVIFSSDTD